MLKWSNAPISKRTFGATNRRTFIRAAAGAPFVAAIGSEAHQASGARKKQKLQFGAAVQAGPLYGNAAFATGVVEHCQILVPEYELNWDKVCLSAGHFNFYLADQIAIFAKRYGKTMTGHVLVWHLSIPSWATARLSEPLGWDYVRQYFSAVIPRYEAVIDHWDVVNEPLLMGHRQDGLRPSPFLAAFGPSYIARAFRDAREFAPHATLSLNEFGMIYEYQEDRDKRYLFLKLLEQLKKSDVPITGIGLQSHLDLKKQEAFKEKDLGSFIKDVSDFGLELRITELDVKEYEYTASKEVRDLRVADAVRRYLDVVTASPALTEITCWGMSDSFSWLHVEADDIARGHWQTREGPGLNRGLPFDTDMQPKPMWAVIKAALE